MIPINGIHVGTIAIDKAALGMDDITDLLDVVFKQPQGVGIGDHNAGGIFVHGLGNRGRLQDAVGP